MKIWVFNKLYILIWVLLFIFITFLKLSRSNSSSSTSTSLVPHSPDLLPSTTRHDAVLVATLDGTISFVEIESRKILWSVKTGLPIYTSYQASQNPDLNLRNASEVEVGDDTYIDCGDDWNLYKHDRSKGIMERLKNAKDLISETKLLSKNGSSVIGHMASTVIVVDANTGSVLRTVRFPGFSDVGTENGENPIVVREESKEQIFITRTDYSFLAYSKLSGKVLWNVTLAEFEAESLCSEADSSTASANWDQIGGFFKSSSCQRRTIVYRIRDRGFSDFISGAGMLNEMSRSLSGNMLPSLPAPKRMHPSLPFDEIFSGYSDEKFALALPSSQTNGYVQPSDMLALPSPDIPTPNHSGNGMHHGSNVAHLLWSPILSGLPLLFALVYSIYRSVILRDKKQSEDSKSKATVAKRKKPRKSGNNKNSTAKNNNNDNNSKSKADDLSVTELPYPDKNLQSSVTGFVNAEIDGRNIGKLWVSSKEIAKGSNGTIVVEGNYDGRAVAVKRLVRTHNDVAVKEIQNLMASDHLPNIVRFYGVEFDSDFVYLALERCLCSLNDFICFYSESSQNSTTSKDVDSLSPNCYTVQVPDALLTDKDIEWWKSNGYPSPHLLKLMRDVVSGVAHLHELGFVHRDLKPQNILIAKDRIFSAKLSDMGISKRLAGDVSSLTQQATGAGSCGWRSPEQILNGRQTRAVDLFSLGCILFFCMTGGKHPFGDMFERDANIVKNKKDLFLVEHVPEAVDLLNLLLDPDPDLRPKAADVLKHPLFWSSDTRLSFLRDASDRVELEDREPDSDLLKALEATASKALGGGKWDEKLESSFLSNISKYRKYKYESVRDLLRVIRNKLNHYRELPTEIQQVLGSVPQGFDNYFTVGFPDLLIEVYKVIHEYCQEEELFCKYFNSSLL